MRQSVVIHDPDGINPYGRELAIVLARSRVVTLILARDADWLPEQLRIRPILPGNRGGSRSSQGLALLRGLVAVVRACAFGRATLVVAWSRSFAEDLCFAVLALTGTHVVVVEHNPRPRQKPSSVRARSMRLVRRTSAVQVVHGSTLRDMVLAETAHPRVVSCMHPPYTNWWAWASSQLPPDPADKVSRLLVLGRPRPDKGIDELAGILAALPVDVRASLVLRISGYVAAGEQLPPLGHLVSVEDFTANRFLSDLEVAQALASSSLLLAPLRGATQSGSIILALSAGLGVLAYDEGEIAAVLDDQGLVPPGDQGAFAQRLAGHVHGERVGAARMSMREWEDRCHLEWNEVMVRTR